MSSCSPGQSYVYETGYNVLLGYFGVQKDLLDLAKLFFFLTVALSAVFAMEQETGVAVLQTAGRRRTAACCGASCCSRRCWCS